MLKGSSTSKAKRAADPGTLIPGSAEPPVDLSLVFKNLSLIFKNIGGVSLYSTEALTGVLSGAKSRPPCASRLCDPVPKYESREDGGIFWID